MNHVKRLFEEDASFYRLFLVVGFLTAVLKGLQMPYPWAATQAQIDYRDGFLRRGLFGEVCRLLRAPIWHYGVFSLVSFLILFTFFVLFFSSIRRSGMDRETSGSFTALLMGSFCITFMTNIVGFFDVLLAVLVLVVLRAGKYQLAVALFAGVVGVMVHELYAIAFLPVSLVGGACWANRSWKRWAAVITVAVVPWIVVYGMVRRPELTVAQTQLLAQQIDRRVDFPAYNPVILVLATSQSYNLKLMSSIMKAGSWWIEEFFGLLAFLPLTLFCLLAAWKMTSSYWRGVRCYIFLSIFSPLALNLIGFDRYRWLNFMELNSMLCLIGVAWTRHRQGDSPHFGPAWRRAAILLLAVNLSTDIGFFMGHASSFPFQQIWHLYRLSKHSHIPLLAGPEPLLTSPETPVS